MDLKPSEISALIKKQIQNYDSKIVADDIGTVVKIGDGIAMILYSYLYYLKHNQDKDY